MEHAVAEKGIVAVQGASPAVRIEINPEALIEKAIAANVPIETMQRLLDMRAQLKAEQAREAFFRALSKFQSECPTIEKKKQVFDKYGKARYKYAPLEDIVEQVKEPLERNGFSYTMKSKQDAGTLTTVCSIHHESGHTEDTEITVPVQTDGFMSSIQQIGSAVTYSKRYAFCNGLGIMTGDEDNDATSPEVDQKKPSAPLTAPVTQRPHNPQAPAKTPAPAKSPDNRTSSASGKIKEGNPITGDYWKQNAAGKEAMLEAGCKAEKINGVWLCVRK